MLLLALGATAGIALAALGLLGSPRGGSLPPDAVARVNGQTIGVDDYQRTLAAVASDKRAGVDDDDRQRVLERLIDEELLLQRGLELGLVRSDARVRKDLTQAVIEGAVAGAGEVRPSDEELQAFYKAERDFFTQPGRLRVRQIWFKVISAVQAEPALERARAAVARLRAGEDFATVRDAVGDHEITPLPDAPLPPAKLVDYLGPTAVKAVAALSPGETSEPVRSATGYHVLQVVEREPAAAPPLTQIRPVVLGELRRRAGEKALRAYLDDLRARAMIERTSRLPGKTP